MADELKPCPFCGGEARIIAKPYEPKFCVGCDDDTCLGFSGLGWLYDSEQEAAEAWNRRAERTCHDTGARKVFFVCSECGEAYRKDSMRLWHHKPWSFCPNCGARVIEEES